MMKQFNINCKKILILGEIIIGIIAFISIYGYQVLNVTYVDWLYAGGDLTQHYLGWSYFRSSPWKFPIGLMEGFTDIDVCIIYTDSIPLFSILFKCFRAFLPETFQYFGIWGIISYILMAVLSGNLLYKWFHHNILCWIASIFFTVSPYMLARMFGHTALGGQWIILLCFNIWIYDIAKDHLMAKTVLWSLMLSLASLIHIYFIPMVGIFICADMIRHFIYKQAIKGITLLVFPIVNTLLILGVVGAFHGASATFSADGLGYYSTNLNSLFNPLMGISRYLTALPQWGGQYEGLGYLGLGMIVATILALCLCVVHYKNTLCYIRDHLNIIIPNLFIVLIMEMLALSPRIMFGDKLVLDIKYPEFIMNILSVFRSSGRFIWVVCYFIFLFDFYVFSRFIQKSQLITVLTGILCILQISDLSGFIGDIHRTFSSKTVYQNPLTVDAWDALMENKTKIIFSPADYPYNPAYGRDTIYQSMPICIMANERKLTLNSYYVTRMNSQALLDYEADYFKMISQEKAAAKDFVYVFWNKGDILGKNYDLFFYQIDNIVVGVSEPVNDILSYENTLQVNPAKLEVSFKDLHLLSFDNTEPKPINEKVYIGQYQLMYGPYYNLCKGIYDIEISGTDLDFLTWELVGEESQQTYNILELQGNTILIRLELPEDVEKLEIKALNVCELEAVIDQITIQPKPVSEF